ncbi:MAG: hypothetical protein ACLUOF_09155 [Ruminococcus sp.]
MQNSTVCPLSPSGNSSLPPESRQLCGRSGTAELPTVHGHFQMFGFRNTINGATRCLVMGDVSDGEPVLCRVTLSV